MEDDSADVEFARVAFKDVELDAHLHVERDGDSALKYLRGAGVCDCGKAGCLPDLVVLDLNLPKVEGLEVLRRMRRDERTKHVPVAVLTSSNLPEERQRAMELGANLFFTKPSDFASFVEIARRLGSLVASLRK